MHTEHCAFGWSPLWGKGRGQARHGMLEAVFTYSRLALCMLYVLVWQSSISRQVGISHYPDLPTKGGWALCHTLMFACIATAACRV